MKRAAASFVWANKIAGLNADAIVFFRERGLLTSWEYNFLQDTIAKRSLSPAQEATHENSTAKYCSPLVGGAFQDQTKYALGDRVPIITKSQRCRGSAYARGRAKRASDAPVCVADVACGSWFAFFGVEVVDQPTLGGAICRVQGRHCFPRASQRQFHRDVQDGLVAASHPLHQPGADVFGE